MAKFTNASGGVLILVDQREIASGQDVEITAEGEKNVAVSQWIAEGKLVKAGKADAKSDK